MSDEETIAVADVSAGKGGATDAASGEPVELPAVEVLTGRAFVTGKSGSGKSNTASVVVERLLDNNFPVMIVDSDGEYYGLKEEYEVLHAGADEECDIQVSPEHAEKLATLALAENVPIILDVSGYLDESEASELILAVARQLFAKEKKLKKPFLLLVEECHEYVPEGAGLDETGKMLIKIGKRGRKHGLGIVGISQRPADVKKDFITQCDWLVWHRLTWDNDTKVVGRVLGSAYADAVEDLDDGEAFLMADWEEAVRRVKFHRKKTFDAGATPGLEDFERPELKSVGGDLVSELESITDERVRRESELADLRQELDKKRQRIQELERELEEARDMSEMADRFAQALLQKAEAPYRSGRPADVDRTPDPVPDASEEFADAPDAEAADAPDSGSGAPSPDAGGPEPVRAIGGDEASDEADGGDEADGADGAGDGADGDDGADGGDGPDGAAADPPGDGSEPSSASSSSEADGESIPGGRANRDGDVAVDDDAVTAETASAASLAGPGGGSDEPTTDATPEPTVPFETAELADREAVVAGFVRAIDALEPITRAMLAHYRSAGLAAPIDAHVAAGGSGERSYAYARNRRLRLAGLVEHVARGRYRYALPSLVGDIYAGASQQAVADAVAAIEAAAGIADPDDDPTAAPEER